MTRRVDRHELAHVPMPERTETYCPLSHSRVVDEAHNCLLRAGFSVRGEEYKLAKDDQQLFAILDMESELASGVTLSVGVRNSLNRTLSVGLVAGERVICCSNLQFGGDIVIAHKHTRYVERGFREKVETAIAGLRQYVQVSQGRIASLQEKRLEPAKADSLILRSYEEGIVGARLLPKLLSEWREPSYSEFEEPTAWSLLQAYTHVMKERQKERPIEAATECMRFQNFVLAA